MAVPVRGSGAVRAAECARGGRRDPRGAVDGGSRPRVSAQAERATRAARRARGHLGAPLPRGRTAAHDAAPLARSSGVDARRRPPAHRAMGGSVSPVATTSRGVRPALRRLAHYVRHSRRYYAVWMVVTLGYVAGFVA